jgi:dUTPase
MKPKKILTVHGRIISEAELDRMAIEAEAGYDLSNWIPRLAPAPPDKRVKRSRITRPGHD